MSGDAAVAAAIPSDRVIALLATGRLTPLGLLPGASNDTFLSRVDGDDLRTLAVYKPRDGEAPLWDFPDGTLYRREMAAYLVDRALGWGFVPPTVIRDGPLGVGMVQLFIDHEPEEHYLTLGPAHPVVFRRVAAFDVVINNADRKSGHCMRQRGSGRIFVVDHGVSFHVHPKLRTVIWEHAGEPLPGDVRAGLASLAAALGGDGDAGRELGALLAPEELDALAARARALLERGAYPEPGPGRPYPWPPI